MGFPKQEEWSELPSPSPGDLPSPGNKTGSPALAGRLFTTEPAWKPELPLVLTIAMVIYNHSTVIVKINIMLLSKL